MIYYNIAPLDGVNRHVYSTQCVFFLFFQFVIAAVVVDQYKNWVNKLSLLVSMWFNKEQFKISYLFFNRTIPWHLPQ